MANTTKLKPRRVNSFNEPSEGKNLWYKNDDQFNRQEWWSWWYQSFFKTQDEYDALPESKESDWNLYIIVDRHRLMEYEELVQLDRNAILNELNTDPAEYAMKFSGEWHIYYDSPWWPCLSDDGETERTRLSWCVIYVSWNSPANAAWDLGCPTV